MLHTRAKRNYSNDAKNNYSNDDLVTRVKTSTLINSSIYEVRNSQLQGRVAVLPKHCSVLHNTAGLRRGAPAGTGKILRRFRGVPR